MNAREQNPCRDRAVLEAEDEIEAECGCVAAPEVGEALFQLLDVRDRHDSRKEILADEVGQEANRVALSLRLEVQHSSLCIEFQ